MLGVWGVQRAVRTEYLLLSALHQLDTLPKNAAPLDAGIATSKAKWLAQLRLGNQLNPHYRQFTPLAAEITMAQADWLNTTWILESAVTSRPFVYAFWFGLARTYTQMGRTEDAIGALMHLEQLRPRASATRVMEIVVANLRGDDAQAKALLQDQFAHPSLPMDYQIPQTGYALGLKLHDQGLVIQSLELRNRLWPQQAADGYFRMGLSYSEMEPRNTARALQAFTQGLQQVAPLHRNEYLRQVPEVYREQLQR